VEELQKCISPDKDVDGFRRDSCFSPCTPKGIDDWLEYNNYDFVGKNAVVLGRSPIVGLPMTNILIKRGCTVTCCNSHTDTFSRLSYLKNANLIISAVGKPKFLDVYNFLNAVVGNDLDIVVDVGINRDENGKLCGDVDPTDFEKFLPDTYLTPVPGGVGLLTRTRLMQNVVEAYELHEKG
jgi:methylenetetrahydrofolate dehydrogenase (NADP+)/methenyltetrahydrofolate cyclohydrolase